MKNIRRNLQLESFQITLHDFSKKMEDDQVTFHITQHQIPTNQQLVRNHDLPVPKNMTDICYKPNWLKFRKSKNLNCTDEMISYIIQVN